MPALHIVAGGGVAGAAQDHGLTALDRLGTRRHDGAEKILCGRMDAVLLHEGAQVGRRGPVQDRTDREGGHQLHPGEAAL